jgi:hypothetical protein
MVSLNKENMGGVQGKHGWGAGLKRENGGSAIDVSAL